PERWEDNLLSRELDPCPGSGLDIFAASGRPAGAPMACVPRSWLSRHRLGLGLTPPPQRWQMPERHRAAPGGDAPPGSVPREDDQRCPQGAEQGRRQVAAARGTETWERGVG
ncbi:hypothetical protein H1C71_042464, partial [Ictidomys tridecemlineatus]